MTTLLQLTEEARATCEREKLFRHDVLAWIPPFASLSTPTLPTSASTNAITYMSFHIFLFRGKTWGEIALLWFITNLGEFHEHSMSIIYHHSFHIFTTSLFERHRSFQFGKVLLSFIYLFWSCHHPLISLFILKTSLISCCFTPSIDFNHNCSNHLNLFSSIAWGHVNSLVWGRNFYTWWMFYYFFLI